MTTQICCNCKKEFEGVYKKSLSKKDFLKQKEALALVFGKNRSNEVRVEFCEFCGVCQLIKEKEDE